MKRLFDIVLSFTALVIFSPLLIPISILLKLSGEGEILYIQNRVGHKNERFGIWKFATMLKNSPSMLTGDVTLKDDPRVLPMGKWLRKTKINELPQIINVLKGDMSIVGARPVMERSFNEYSAEAQEKIYKSRPGITGISSLVFRDEESILAESGEDPMDFYNNKIIPYKNALDVWYQEHRNLWVDLKIVVLTAVAIVLPNLNLTDSWFKNLPNRKF